MVNKAQKVAAKEVGEAKLKLIGVDVPRLEEGMVNTGATAVGTISFGFWSERQAGVVRVYLNKGEYLAQVTDETPPTIEGTITRCPSRVLWKVAVKSGVPAAATATLRLEQQEGQWRWDLSVPDSPASHRVFDADHCSLMEVELAAEAAPLTCEQYEKTICGAISGVDCFRQAGVLGSFGVKVTVRLRNGRTRHVQVQGRMSRRVKRCLAKRAKQARLEEAEGKAKVVCSWGGTLMPGGRMVSAAADCELE